MEFPSAGSPPSYLPWQHLFGQATMVRDVQQKTALVCIVEAAIAQLDGFASLLDPLLGLKCVKNV